MLSIIQSKTIQKIKYDIENKYGIAKSVQVLSWHKKDTEYYELSPYFLKTDGNEIIKNDGNVIFENFWQGSKVYDFIYDIEIYPHYSFKGNKKYLWWEWKDGKQ